DWFRHHHASDKQYQNVILHVVWDADQPAPDIPTLELNGRVSGWLLERYKKLMLAPHFIACSPLFHQVRELTVCSWLERQLISRLQTKAGELLHRLSKNKNYWEETLWQLLARNFGMPVNADTFESVALSIPMQILLRHRSQIHQLEALLLGQAGMLDGYFKEDYPIMLKKEYYFLKKKYKLIPPPLQMKQLRMRPAHFPAIRLAQLAMVINSASPLFSAVTSASGLKEIRNIFDITANDYWHYHFRLDELSGYQPKRLGMQMINNIIINTVIPMLFTYGHFQQNDEIITRCLNWLTQIPPENNSILTKWKDLNVKPENAGQSQALIQLTKSYCMEKRCLDCAIGNAVLNKEKEKLRRVSAQF
ncbi:MAG TPA: DUF2851 family protein, partial [Parasegetibacter sp.]